MKHQATLATGLAALALAPVALQEGELRALESALAGTVHALEVLTGIAERLETDPAGTTELVLGATERPHLEPGAGDERLQTLRNEVSLLQMELDAFESPGFATAPNPPVSPEGPPATEDAPDTARTAPVFPVLGERLTTGLDDALRDLVRAEIHDPPDAARERPERTETLPAPPSPEGEDYSADPLLHARACYHGQHFQQGLDLLEGRSDVQSLYWRSRCLARLERLAEAIDLLARIVEVEGDSYEGRRAANDLEFLRWKQEFVGRLPERLGGQGREG